MYDPIHWVWCWKYRECQKVHEYIACHDSMLIENNGSRYSLFGEIFTMALQIYQHPGREYTTTFPKKSHWFEERRREASG